jgi:hypothetical protein
MRRLGSSTGWVLHLVLTKAVNLTFVRKAVRKGSR